jgi:hypothetical protein
MYPSAMRTRTMEDARWHKEKAMPVRPRSGTRKATVQEQREAASAVAITALSFIASEPERLGRFLALTGIGPESLRSAARHPGFLAGVLDHLASDDQLLREFAEQNEFDPGQVMKARELLSGEPPQGS